MPERKQHNARLDFGKLNYFVAVHRSGGFSNAARELRVSQSSLSKAVS
ncbi:MAG: LysR family transcriptional regulator [Bdellovibrionota bacterium]